MKKPEAASAALGPWWWAVCRPKHVELHINMEEQILIHCCILLDFFFLMNCTMMHGSTNIKEIMGYRWSKLSGPPWDPDHTRITEGPLYLNNAKETEVAVQDYCIHTVVPCDLWRHRYRLLPSKQVSCLWWSTDISQPTPSTSNAQPEKQRVSFFVNFLRSADVLRSTVIILVFFFRKEERGGVERHMIWQNEKDGTYVRYAIFCTLL